MKYIVRKKPLSISLFLFSLIFLTACSGKTNVSDSKGEYIYRVVGNSRDGFKKYVDDAEDMHKYPDGIDFKTREEASEYIFNESGGRFEL